MNASGLVVRTWNDAPISRRDSDGFADATAMCQANGKLWGHYRELERTTAYIAALGDSLNLPADQLVLTTTSGPNHLRGTWIHPRLAVDLARWLSPQFAVWMDGWFLEALSQAPQPAQPTGPGDFSDMAALDRRWAVISRTSTDDQWHAQPQRLQQAQRLLFHEELRSAGICGGHSNRSIGQWFVDNPPVAQISAEAVKQISSLVAKQLSRAAAVLHTPTQLEELTSSAEWVIGAIHSRRTLGLTATSDDLASMTGCTWRRATVSNRLTELRRQGLVTKRHRGWHLTPAAEQLLAAA